LGVFVWSARNEKEDRTMAFEEGLTAATHSFPASGDLSGNQYYGVKLDSNGRLALSGEGDKTVGVLQDKPAALGRAGCVAIGGTSKALAGGTINPGDRVSTNSTGRFVTVGSGDDWSFGIARAGAAIGEVFPMLIQPTGPTL
jgi:hypothetical protein